MLLLDQAEVHKMVQSEKTKKLIKIAQKIIVGLIIGLIIGLVLFVVSVSYYDNSEKKQLESQIEPLLRKADSLAESREFEEAINKYEDVLNLITPNNLPVKYALTQNNLGTAYSDLADVRNKESNLEKAINAFNETLKIRTVEKYPIDYAETQNNLGVAYWGLADVRDKESNLEKSINAYNEALKICTVEK